MIIAQTIPNIDRAVSLWMHRHAHPWLDTLMYSVTHLGDLAVLAVFTLIMSLFYLWRYRDLRAFSVMFLVLMLSWGLNTILKMISQRERPELWEGAIHPDSYSFPSGHAMDSAAVYGLGSILLAAIFPKHRRIILCTMGTIVFLIGLSRIYLGAHWMSDVIGGFVVGTALSILLGLWYVRGKRPQNPS